MTRVKLMSLWAGELPPWMPKFQERLANLGVVDWSLIHLGVEEINKRASISLGVNCRKNNSYAQCDLRPFLARMFPEMVEGFDWWGWCDLDIVLGDLDSLLPPLLEEYDVISVEPFGTAGAMTLLRNNGEVAKIVMSPGWQKAIESPTYENWDETAGASLHVGNREPSLTTSVLWSGLQVRLDDRSWADSWYTGGNHPSRYCRVEDKRVIEVPLDRWRAERELLLYHFSKGKAWPLQN